MKLRFNRRTACLLLVFVFSVILSCSAFAASSNFFYNGYLGSGSTTCTSSAGTGVTTFSQGGYVRSVWTKYTYWPDTYSGVSYTTNSSSNTSGDVTTVARKPSGVTVVKAIANSKHYVSDVECKQTTDSYNA